MNKTISIVILIAGIALLVFGISATDSFSSDLSRLFTGSPTNKAIWLLISGAVISAVGAIGLLRGAR
jgi:hypothetical protein